MINLIAVTRTQDDFGVWRESETSRQIFCQVDSITASEFFEGGRNGLNPEFRFRVFNADYEDSEGVDENLTKEDASFFSKSGAVACATGAVVGILACLNAKDKLACAIAAGAAGCAVARKL